MTQTLQLPDGREISYLVSGAADGFPLIFLHGTPGYCTIFADLAATCETKRVKLITIARPGYGGSARKQGRRVVDIVNDVQLLSEHLGINKCFVAGWSGGGPHALACAARLPGCAAALSVAGVGPFDADDLDFLTGQGEANVVEYQAAFRSEADLRKFCDVEREAMMQCDGQGLINAMASVLPQVDKDAILGHADFAQYFGDSIHRGLATSCDGWIDDDFAFIQPWGFDLDEIKVPVLLYQGSEDKMVPFSHGKWLASHLPAEVSDAHFFQGQGHISIMLDHMDTMIEGLLKYC